jgi:hypothetical protein
MKPRDTARTIRASDQRINRRMLRPFAGVDHFNKSLPLHHQCSLIGLVV